MIERIFKNWKTSLVGLILLGIAVLGLVMKEATIEQAGGFMVLAFGFFFAKNKKNTA